MFSRAAIKSKSTAPARSIFVITQTSAVLKIVGYFNGFSSPSGNGLNKHEPQPFAQVVTRWTNQVPDVLNKKCVQVRKVPVCKRVLDHRCIEVTDRSGNDLLHRRFAARESSRVVLGSKISNQRRDPHAVGTQARQRVFQ